jgi:hypothetical protein
VREAAVPVFSERGSGKQPGFFERAGREAAAPVFSGSAKREAAAL